MTISQQSNKVMFFSYQVEIRVYIQKLGLLYLASYIFYYYFSFVSKILITLNKLVSFLIYKIFGRYIELLNSILLL